MTSIKFVRFIGNNKGKNDCMNFTYRYIFFFTALDQDLMPVEGDWIEEGHKTSPITTQTQIITGIAFYCVKLRMWIDHVLFAYQTCQIKNKSFEILEQPDVLVQDIESSLITQNNSKTLGIVLADQRCDFNYR